MKSRACFLWVWFVIAFPAETPGAVEEPRENEQILPLVANGVVRDPTHFQATFTFLNLSDSTVHGTLTVYDDGGKVRSDFLTCELVADPPEFLELSIPPKGVLYHTGISHGELVDGWGRVLWEGPASLRTGVELTLLSGEPGSCEPVGERSSEEVITVVHSEGVVPAVGFGASATITPGRHTAFALVNQSTTETATVELVLLDGGGQPVDGNSFQIPPRHRLSDFLWNLTILGKVFIVPPVPPDDFYGSVRITSDAPIAVSGLHVLLPEGKYVNLPVTGTGN